jgi:hypothetical protein
MKTLDKLLSTRPWIAFIDDERGDGNSIIVTLSKEYKFADEFDCGVRGFDSIKECERDTRKNNIEKV